MIGSNIMPYQDIQQAAFQFWAKPVIELANGTYFTPGFDGPAFMSSPWDYIKVGTTYGPPVDGAPPDRTPGVCRIRLKKEYSIDKKKPAGGHGARVTFHGIDPAEFDIEIRIWTPEQLRQLGLLWDDLFPPAGKGSPIAFDVQHPLLTLHHVKAIQFVSGEGPDIQGDRSAIFRIRAVEFLKPITGKSAVKTDEGAMATVFGPGDHPPPSANAANLGPR